MPQRPDRARQRAGDRRPLRALRPRGRGAPARAVVLPHHRLRRPAARRPRHDRLARARQDDAAQLDRPQRRAPRSRSAARSSAIDYPVFTTRPDTLFGATFFVMAPEHPDVFRLAAGTAARAAGPRLRQPRADRVRRGPRRRRQAEDRRAARAHRHQPGQRRADPDVRRRLRADGVRDRRDHGRARATTSATTPSRSAFDLPIRQVIAPADGERPRARRSLPTRRRARWSTPASSTGMHNREGQRGDRRLARPRGQRPRRRSTTACATGCSRASATGAARSRSSTASACGMVPVPEDQLPVELPDVEDYQPKGRSPLAAAEDWVNTSCPQLRRAGPPRDRHDGHVRRLELVLPALLRRRATTRPPGTARCWTSGCPSTSTSAASSTRSCT